MSAAPIKPPSKLLLTNAKAKLLSLVQSGISKLQSQPFSRRQSWLSQILLTSLVAELFFGFGAQPEWFGITLRTCFLIIAVSASIPLFFSTPINRPFKIGILGIGILVFLASILGLKNHHALAFVKADIVPFLYFGLVWSFTQLNPSRFSKLISVFTIFACAKSLLFFIGFTNQIFVLQDPAYKFIRDVWAGKITFVTDYFYRIVFPEHLLLVPLFIYFVFSYHTTPRRQTLALMLASGTVLALNFSRGYWLGLAGGILFLLFTNKFSARALKTSVYSALSVLVPLILLVFVTSHGRSFGLELFSSRLSSIVVPVAETSGATRLALLEPIKQQITTAPWFGQGLGSSVTFFDPVKKQTLTTTQYDWGYLELIAEFGILSAVFYVVFWIYAAAILYKKQRPDLSAALLSLLIVTVTAPALFHIYGIIFLVFCLADVFAPRAV